MNEIELKIIEKLRDTEKIENIKIFWAIESGSRSWGFPSIDSDYDCRFIYVNPKDYYLSIFEQKDFISYTPDEIYDIAGWNIKKVLRQLNKSNASVFEWLSSDVIYLENPDVKNYLKDVSANFFNPISLSYHYLNLARKKYDDVSENEKSKLKTYFYILRPIANFKYIFLHNEMPPINYNQTIQNIDLNSEILSEINALLNIKKDVSESYLIEKNELLINYFKNEFLYFENNIKNLKMHDKKNSALLDDVFGKIIETVWA